MRCRNFYVLITLVAFLLIGTSFANAADKNFNVPIYLKTSAGIEMASSDQLRTILYGKGFEITEGTETIAMKDCSLRASGGNGVYDDIINLGDNNKLSFNINYLANGNGELILQNKWDRLGVKFQSKKITKTDSNELIFEGVGTGTFNKKNVKFDYVKVSVDKQTNKVSIEGTGNITFSVNNMGVYFTEGCFNETKKIYEITDRGQLQKRRTTKEVKSILDNHPEFVDMYERLMVNGIKGATTYDQDGDGFLYTDDCNDNNADIYPGAVEVPYDGIDQDCSGADLKDVDGDEYDAVIVGGTDCDDNNAKVNPGMAEVCNYIDDNCNAEIDEGVKLTFYQDFDVDTYGNNEVTILDCSAPSGYVADNTDCDDNNENINPGMEDAECDGIDNNCDGTADDEYAPSATTCGIGACAAVGTLTCEAGDEINSCTPGIPIAETCDTFDNDCDAETDEGLTQPASNVQGLCSANMQTCVAGAYVDDTTNYIPVEEICDNFDNDCDAETDEELTAPLADNQNGICGGSLKICNGAEGWIEPAYTEIVGYESVEASCDNLDNDCSGAVDAIEIACGTDICEGTSLCTAGEWGDCSTNSNDAGTCAVCDANGDVVFDPSGTEQGDCNSFNLPALSQCDYTPDGNSYTLDTHVMIASVCGAINTCSTVAYGEIAHTCDIDSCGAQCENSGECQPKCEGNIYYNGGSCSDGCTCTYVSEDCDVKDGWYDTGSTQLVNTDACNEKEQKEQEYRDYSCGVGGCEYAVTDTQWIDTGAINYEPDGTVCDDTLSCTVNDMCTSGICGGVQIDTNDNVACTIDSCNEESDTIEHALNNALCSDGLYCNGQETCSLTGCVAGTAADCSINNILGISICLNNPDNNPLTWDYREAFISQCTEGTGNYLCSSGNPAITSTCNLTCGAGCLADVDCAVTDCDTQDGCFEGTYKDYSDATNTCVACQCTTNTCTTPIDLITDVDVDGYDTQCDNDCNDNNGTINPAATEICGNDIDEDCDGIIDEEGCTTPA